MSIKEFSQKNSIVLFYTTIVLIILLIIMGFCSFGRKGGPGREGFNNNPKRMMQNDRMQNTPGNNTPDNIDSTETNGELPETVSQ